MTLATMVCLMVTASALFYVFYLLGTLRFGPEKTRFNFLDERKEAVYENLRDLHFEYRAGKVPDVDYQSLKSSLEEEAAAILSEMARPEQVPEAQRSQKEGQV